MILTMITAGSIFSLLVTSVKFVNKGELVVTGSGDNTVHVWKRSEKGSYKCKDIVDHHTAEGMVLGDTRRECRTITRSLDIIKNRVSLRDLS
ncbi:pre-mRNA-processing factor 19 homolog 2-like isoform X1 [Apium graveolens]|uniref:pre-mRNA-processing factor 19 homolog 2-like isoform X1 n=1 Tax=Apium graveolens TaxID=4045 RepID=UPI003D7975C5